MTRITILMTVYNGMPYLPDAVQSIRNQTLQDWRFVIVNDGSTDGSREYLESVRDDRLVILHQENRGTAAAANHGLEACHARYVARMDSDDVSLPTRLERQLTFLEAHSEVGLVGAQIVPLGIAGAGASLHLPLEHDAIMADLLAGRHALAHSCIMMRTDLLREIGGYWPYRLNDAWDMMLRMGEVSRLANLDEVLHHYRVHSASLNGSAMRRMRWSIDYACELARRRRMNRPPISYAQFESLRQARPLRVRVADAVNLHARIQYRVALAEIYGNRPLWGRTRMVWACLCSPRLTVQRLLRMIRRDPQPAQPSELSQPANGAPLAVNVAASAPVVEEVTT